MLVNITSVSTSSIIFQAMMVLSVHIVFVLLFPYSTSHRWVFHLELLSECLTTFLHIHKHHYNYKHVCTLQWYVLQLQTLMPLQLRTSIPYLLNFWTCNKFSKKRRKLFQASICDERRLVSNYDWNVEIQTIFLYFWWRLLKMSRKLRRQFMTLTVIRSRQCSAGQERL